MNNKFKKIAYSIVIAIIMCFNFIYVYATSTTDLQNKKSAVQDEINEASSEIAGVRSQMTAALSEVNRINNEITSCETKIAGLENQINELGTQITEKQKNIDEQQAKYDEQQRLLDKRLVAVYESGNTTYLDVLLSSSSLTDFISKYYLIEKLAKCDTELLTQIQELKTQIENEKAELESSKKQVEIAKTSVETEKESLQSLAKQKQSVVATLSAEEKSLQAQLDELEKDKREIQNEIAKIEAENRRKQEEEAKRNASSTSSASISYSPSGTTTLTGPSASGFICPIAGRSRIDITTGYGAYRGHTGCDFARNSKGPVDGLPVIAAKSGTVIKSVAKKIGSTYVSYGEYVVISHGDGTYTLYAHMQPGSRKVSQGDKVSQGQQIGNVGTTGNSTGPHLHFEIRTATGYVNPANYLP